ncbi:MAG TPA: response regulator transcription factor [Gammaproteobacteria bacterium]|nr:response regulator transcription factor [Gammaproteobacteria bacterium]
MSKVLIVESDQGLTRALETALTGEGYEVVIARNGIEALQAVQKERPDEVILDPTLAWLGGSRVRQAARPGAQGRGEPIILLSLRTNESRRVLPLPSYARTGTGETTAQFFDIDELLTNVRALQKRALSAAPAGILRAGVVEMNLETWAVTVKGQPITLTAKEFGLLRMLLNAKERVLTREMLREVVWEHGSGHTYNSRTVDVHIGRLRRKLGLAGRYIATVRGVGYRFTPMPART